jgi:hypothetical protein
VGGDLDAGAFALRIAAAIASGGVRTSPVVPGASA